MRGRSAIVPLILILAFFGWAYLFGRPSDPTDFDLSVLRTASHLRSPFMSRMFLFVTQLGRTPVALMFVAIAWRRSRTLATHLAAATLGGLFLAEVLKRVFTRPRPIEILPLVEASGYSFPSGHAVVAAATYTTAAILICRGLPRQSSRILVMAAAILTIALVAFSRVYLGVHYASDVIGGVMIGTAWASILAQRWYDFQNVPRKDVGYEELDDNNTRG